MAHKCVFDANIELVLGRGQRRLLVVKYHENSFCLFKRISECGYSRMGEE